MRGYERQDLFDVWPPPAQHHPQRPRRKELRDTLKAQSPNLDFRAAVLAYTGAPITVTWPIDNGRSTVTRVFHPPFTPVDREDDYRVAYEVFSQRLNLPKSPNHNLESDMALSFYRHDKSTLKDLIGDASANQWSDAALIPDLQRPYVWSPFQVSLLIDSMLKGWPFGTLLLWSVSSLEFSQIPRGHSGR